MKQFTVETNIDTWSGNAFWVQVVPTDGRPGAFGNVRDAMLFRHELETMSDLEFRIVGCVV